MKKTTKGAWILALCCILALALAACTTGGSGSSDIGASQPGSTVDEGVASGSGRTDKDTIRIGVWNDSGSLDPIYISGMGGYLGAESTYMEPLFNYRGNGERVWQLATSIDYVSETEMTIHLREDVTFHNGSPFTAEDVMFSFQRFHDDPVKLLNVQEVDFEKTNIVDDYTIDLWYLAPNAAQEMMFSQVWIFDAETFDQQDFSMHPIGTGPYIVTDYVVSSHIYMESFPDYWDGAAPIKNIQYKCLNEPSQRTTALETGDIDYVVIQAKDAEYIKSLGNYNIFESSMGMSSCAYFNMTPGGPLGTKEARDAISYAIDREAIKEVAHNGYAGIVSWPVSDSNVDFAAERFGNQYDTYATGYDLDKAKELAEKSGLAGKTIKMMTNGDTDYVTAAEIIQADLATIGVTAEIVNYDQATYFSMLMDASNFDIGLYSTSAPSLMAADIFYSYPMFLPLGWEETERQAFIDEGKKVLEILDDSAREDALYDHVQNFYNYNPWYGICDIVTLSAYSSDIEGFEVYLLGNVPVEKLSFK